MLLKDRDVLSRHDTCVPEAVADESPPANRESRPAPLSEQIAVPDAHVDVFADDGDDWWREELEVGGGDGRPTAVLSRSEVKVGDTLRLLPEILKKRFSSHHRGVKVAGTTIPYATTSRSVARGLEQLVFEKNAKAGRATDQINPISPKNKNRPGYMEAGKRFLRRLKK